jgi:hypothetical protein
VVNLDDDRVISLIRVTSRDEMSGGEVNGEWAWLISVRGGKCVKVRTFTDHGQALEAAGMLSSPGQLAQPRRPGTAWKRGRLAPDVT